MCNAVRTGDLHEGCTISSTINPDDSHRDQLAIGQGQGCGTSVKARTSSTNSLVRNVIVVVIKRIGIVPEIKTIIDSVGRAECVGTRTVSGIEVALHDDSDLSAV